MVIHKIVTVCHLGCGYIFVLITNATMRVGKFIGFKAYKYYCLWCLYNLYLAYITIINKKLESPRSSHTVISLRQAHFYVCGIVSDIDYESPFLDVCVSYIQHWDVRICGKIFYGMWNIHVILFVIQYIHSHFDALLNILQFTFLCGSIFCSAEYWFLYLFWTFIQIVGYTILFVFNIFV